MSIRAFLQSDVERIYFESWGDSEEVVLLGHGMGGSHAVWYQQVAAMTSRLRVITWDQRGFGRSTRISGDIGPVPAVGDMKRLLDHLEIAKAHIVGQSMGGWSALGFAIEHPERASSLVLADSTGGIFTPEISNTLETYGRAIATMPPPDELPIGQHPAVGSQLLSENLAHSLLYSQLGSLTNPPSPSEIIPLLMSTDHTKRVHEVTMPALFVVGEHDPIFPPPLIDAASRFVNGSQVAVIPNTGHSPYFERPEQWNDTVLAFLQHSQSD